jgi:hypothetical protein
VRPGQPVMARDAAVGLSVQAQDTTGLWYNAKILKVLKGGVLRVRFTGYSVKHDKNFTTRQKKVRGRLSKAELDAERDSTIYGDESNVGRNADGTFAVEKVLDGSRRAQAARWPLLPGSLAGVERRARRVGARAQHLGHLPHHRVRGLAGAAQRRRAGPARWPVLARPHGGRECGRARAAHRGRRGLSTSTTS